MAEVEAMVAALATAAGGDERPFNALVRNGQANAFHSPPRTRPPRKSQEQDTCVRTCDILVPRDPAHTALERMAMKLKTARDRETENETREPRPRVTERE